MLCRHCGTEIADKAIICYRCGAGTTDPVRQPALLAQRRSPLYGLVVITILLLVGLYMGQASRTAAEPGQYQITAGVLVAVALVLFIFRIVRRR
jgi:hypothetical protein